MADTGAGDLVVLDMDGVLLHLDLRTERVRVELAALLGAEPRPLVRALEEICDGVSREDPARGQQLREEAWAVIDAEELRAAERCHPVTGVSGLMRALEGVDLALFTNNSRSAVDVALARTGVDASRFAAIRARPGPRSIKPAATPLLSIVDELGRVPSRMFVVGDHPADMLSAEMARPGLLERGVLQVVPIGHYGGDARRAAELDRAGSWFLAANLAEVATLVTMRRAAMGLSVVLLAYNEEELIGQAVEEARRFGQVFLDRQEIVVVDDGSADQTSARATADNRGDVRLVRHERNMGMGAAMRDGYRAASMDYIAHLPGDRQVRPAALAALLPLVGPDRVVITGYHEPPSGWRRAWVSFVFRLFVRYVGGLKVDFAGTYVFHRRYLRLLDDPRAASRSFLLSFELLQLLLDEGCDLLQVSIHALPRSVGHSREMSPRRVLGVLNEVLRHRVVAMVARARGA